MEITNPLRRVSAAALMALVALAPAAAAGDEPPPIQVKIVGGGEVSPPGEYPFMVALVHSDAGAYAGQFCGGSLLSADWVLTAAHCVTDPDDDDAAIPPSVVDVVIGRHDLTDAGEGERIGVASITVHPGYDSSTVVDDVALLSLETPSAFGAVALPAGGGFEEPGTPAVVTGWGDTQSDPKWPQVLQEVTVPLVSDADCIGAYGGLFDPDTMLCAGDLDFGGIDSCYGDSGGPLFIAYGGGWVQLGIVSWGDGDECAAPGYPGVYTRVSAVRTWITDETGVGAPTCGGEQATLWGTDGDDVLEGTAGRDVIAGLEGDDQIYGFGGDDLICGGDGADLIRGGGGNDTIRGNRGGDRIYGGTRKDVLRGGPGRDRLIGGPGRDRLIGGGGRDHLLGWRHADVLLGRTGDDRLEGGAGDDRLVGGGGTDRGDGGGGIDTCTTEQTIDCEA